MALVNYTARNFGLRIQREATFGTAIALSSNGMSTIPIESFTKTDGDVAHDDLMLTDTDRIKDTGDLYTNTINSNSSIPFSTLYRREYASYLLGAIFQTASPGNTGTNPYVHTWTLHPTQPDFSANAGWFYSVVWDDPITAQDHLLKSCILSQFSIKGNPTGKGKAALVTMDGTFWSPFSRAVEQTFSGTPSTPSTNFLNSSLFSVTIAGGSALPVRSFSIDFTCNPFKIPTGGAAATIGWNIPFHSAKLKMELYWNADLAGYWSGLQAGTGYAIVLGNGVATSSYESFACTMNGRPIGEPPADSGGNAVMQLEYELVGSGATAPISLVTTDAITGL